MFIKKSFGLKKIDQDASNFGHGHFWAPKSSTTDQVSIAADLGRPVNLPLMSMTKPDPSVEQK